MSRLEQAAAAAVVILSIGAPAHGTDVPRAEDWLGRDLTQAGATLRAAELHSYSRALSAAGRGVRLEILGLSTDGRPLLALHFGATSTRPRSRAERPLLAVTFGIHSDEVGSSLIGLHLIERLAAQQNRALRAVRERADVCVLPCLNPDGQEQVALWIRAGEPGLGRRLPFLYHRYTGHDLNRDWLLGTQAETRAVITGLHNRRRPALTIDVHQMGWSGPRLFLPPYAKPHDPSVPPELLETAGRLGDSVSDALTAAGYSGVAREWQYDAWSPARAYPFYHGGVRFLIEIASGRFASDRFVSPRALRVFHGNDATESHPAPWRGGRWGLEQAIDYGLAATKATLRAAAIDTWITARREPGSSPARVVRIDGLESDPGLAAELRDALELGGVEITPLDGQRSWLAREPTWGRGWCHALLLCSPYPSNEVSRKPYDTSSHNLALLSGLDARVASAIETTPAAPPETPRQPATSLPRPDPVVGWWISARSLRAFAFLADWIEAGARVERIGTVHRSNSLPGTRLRSGDFLVHGLPDSVLAGVTLDHDLQRPIGQDGWARLRASVDVVPLSYPEIEVLAGPAPSRDEGWLRWLLEDYRFRFRSVSPEAFKEMPARNAETRVVVLAERLRLHEDPALEVALTSFVDAGGRVIALGHAAASCVRFAALSVEPIRPPPRLPGTILATRRPTPNPERSRPLLWGYDKPPRVFYRGGPLWRVPRTPRPSLEAILCVDPQAAPLCGAGKVPASPTPDEELAALVRIERGRGEWVLAGFQPQVRAWPKQSFRVLFNALLAPR